MIKKLKLAVCFAAVGLMASAAAHGDIVANFNTNDVDVDGPADPLPTTEVIAGVTSSSLTQVGLAGFAAEDGGWAIGGWGTTFNDNIYVTATITPDATTLIDFTDVVWDKGFFNVDSSVIRADLNGDGTFTDISSGVGSFANDGGDITYDLSSLTGISSATEFRFFFAGAGIFSDLAVASGDGNEGNTGLTFNGTVSAIPEPTSLGFLSLVGLGLLSRRRR